MLRPPQPAAYLFLLDVSATAAESGYLKICCDTLIEQIDSLPGDSRTQLAFICYDNTIHFYFLGENASRPKEMTVIDIDGKGCLFNLKSIEILFLIHYSF